MALELDNKQSLPSPQPQGRGDNASLRPFDRREFEKLPLVTEDDPPYRPWWVVDRT